MNFSVANPRLVKKAKMVKGVKRSNHNTRIPKHQNTNAGKVKEAKMAKGVKGQTAKPEYQSTRKPTPMLFL